MACQWLWLNEFMRFSMNAVSLGFRPSGGGKGGTLRGEFTLQNEGDVLALSPVVLAL